jgi:hypothetical protein
LHKLSIKDARNTTRKKKKNAEYVQLQQ